MTQTSNTHLTWNKSPWYAASLIVIAASLVMMASGGSRGAFGVFFNPMAGDLDWSAAEISGPFSFSMLVEGIVNFFTGWLSDRFGTRIVLVICGFMSGLGFILMSQVTQLWQMYLVYGIAMGIGLGGIMVPILSTMAKRFTSHRTFITGIALAANGIGQLISPLIAYQLITRYNWQTSYIILAIAVLVLIILPAQLLISSGPKQNNSQTKSPLPGNSGNIDATGFTFKEARSTLTFWMIVIILACYVHCFLSVLVHIVPFSINLGLPASMAANVLACASATTVIGRLVFGAIADKIGNKQMMVIGYGVMTLSFLWLTRVDQEWSVFLFAVVCGFGLGAVSSSQSPITAKLFGSKYHGVIFGAIAGIMIILGCWGPFLTGYLFDLTGGYQLSFLVCSILSALAFIITLFLRPPHKLAKS